MSEQETKPNLTLDPCGGRIIEKGHLFLERYKSLRELALKRNIPRKVLTLASDENAPGMKSGGLVFWELLQPWLADNYERLAEAVKDSEVASDESSLKEQKLIEEIKDLRYKNRARDKAYISRKLVFSTVTAIRNKWVELLRQKLEYEMPGKCKQMDEVNLKAFGRKLVDELLNQFNKPISEWNLKEEAPKEDEPTAGN